MKQDGALCRNDFGCPPPCSGHIQRKIYFIVAIQENLRIFLNCFFTDGVVEGNSIYSAAFCESAALWNRFFVCVQHAEPSQAHIRSPAPPKGELFAVTVQSPDKMQALRMRQKLPLSGELANPKDLTERARMLSLLPRGRLNSLWQSRTPSLLQSILMPCKIRFPSQPYL